MAQIQDSLTVVFRVTDGEWGRRAAAAAMMLYEHSVPKRVEIRRYAAGGLAHERVSSGYEELAGFGTQWLLSIDADSYVCGDVWALAYGAVLRDMRCAIRHSPLQAKERNGWREDVYRALFADAGVPYRRLGTTCAFLLRRDVADGVLRSVRTWRAWIDQRGEKLSRAYHHAQAAFALALALAGVAEDETWWWGPGELSFEGEPPGLIHHEAHKNYRLPYERKEGC